MSQKRKRTPEAASSRVEDVSRSAPIEDRASTFVGFYSPSAAPRALQGLDEIKAASHKILAWRKETNQRSLTGDKVQYAVGHDDDGEKYGGKRVEKVLENMQASGACVVARWYGGVMLGPVRFNHIENCARQAVCKWQEYEAEERTKKRKLEEETAEKGKLVKALAERDQSITVLRTLAAEKEEQVKEFIVQGVESLPSTDGSPRVQGGSSQAEPRVKPEAQHKTAGDYSSMPLDRLKALDKARDATLSFLLKRIDRAEADLAALKEPDKPP